MPTPWSNRYAFRTHTLKSSTIRELLKLTEKPDIISFGGGLPAGESFPIPEIKEACDRVLTDHGASALQYSTTEGYLPLREMIARHLDRYGISARPENVLITSGSQQAMDLIAKLLINRGDHILVEAPTYLGALQAFNVYGANYLDVPVDEQGLRTDLLESALRSGPKFMYVLPNFQNPSGVTMSLERRRELIFLSNKYGVPIIEDDPYGQLRYEGDHVPALSVLDCVNNNGHHDFMEGNVIYMSTFSKTLAPGLRLGWIVAPPDVIAKLVQLKQAADLHTSTFNQMVAYEVARGGFLDEHVKQIRVLYGQRLQAMLDAMDEFFPPGVTWIRPQGGLFLWVTLPQGMSSERLFAAAIEEKVAFVPGDCFYAVPNDIAQRQFRMNFSYMPQEKIREGVRRLSIAMKNQLAETGAKQPQAAAARIG